MLFIGLTGGIGAGKSTVSRRMAQLGGVVIDADAIARQVVEPGTDGLAQIVERFGRELVGPGGALNRAELGRIVFADNDARSALEGITHPLIAQETLRQVEAAGPTAIVVHDIPLLVELHREVDYHLTIIVAASEQVRHDRLVRVRGMEPTDAWARIRAQAGDDMRRAAADVWLPNEASEADVVAAVDALWHNRIEPYAANLDADHGVRRPNAVEICDYDPEWARTGDRLCRRIATQLSSAGLGQFAVDHIGSTAIPGLAAKDVIDLQLQVPDLDLAQQDSFRAALRAAGIVEVRPNQDHPQAWDPDPVHWRKFYANGADPGRVVHLHIRRAGGPAAELALQFRDWLRSDDGERASYEQMKRAVAKEHPGGTEHTKQDYVEAKEPWFAANLPRARAWALRHDE